MSDGTPELDDTADMPAVPADSNGDAIITIQVIEPAGDDES